MRIRFLVAVALAARADASAVNFRGSGRISKPEVNEILSQEIADSDHHLARYEDGLRQMFVSLPKNVHGNLDHQTVRYALHRFFVDKYGWFIDGLEPVVTANASELPSFLQTAFESRLSAQGEDAGVDLYGLAALAASLEDLADKEIRMRLDVAYEANDFSSKALVDYSAADEVLYTLLISFLVANNWHVAGAEDLARKKVIFHNKYREYNNTMAWYTPIRDRFFGNDTTQQVSHDSVAQAASEIGKTYYTLNDVGCKDLRSTLKDMESRKAGRVRLSVFYNMSLHGAWDFTEKVDFLRAVGALDESDPKQTSVIIANYAQLRLNCLNATNLYTICCRNTCDDLTTHLEREIGAPMATVGRIAELVSNLPSETVDAPRQLSTALVDRLSEVAKYHDGQVPLHGRLFAQWMHHAYPLECPYPHEVGKVSAQTPEEWLAQTGQATQEASPAEMRQLVEADSCAVNWEGKVECGEESTELPWSMTEQLLVRSGNGEEAGGEPRRFLVLALLCLSAAVGVTLRVGVRRLRSQPQSVALVSLALASAAYCADLLDGAVFGIALVGSLVPMAAKGIAGQLGDAKGCSLPTRQTKSV